MTRQPSTHECPKDGCTRRVPHEQLACRNHWYRVSVTTRGRVNAAYRGPGPGSDEHLAAIGQAVIEMNGRRS